MTSAMKRTGFGILALALLAAGSSFAANHREAPITALDHKADITDVYAFVSYDENQSLGQQPEKVTLIMGVDPLLEPANGPTIFPFDPEILYEIKVDYDHDAREDVVFQFRFRNEFQLPTVYTALAGVGDSGAFDPKTGALVVPPQIRSFDNPGLNLRQTYTVTHVQGNSRKRLVNDDGSPFFAIPVNAGPRTMDYEALFEAGTYRLSNGISILAGTTDDAFWIDLGATFDTANFRTLGSGIPGVLTENEDSAFQNFASDTISGYAVNSIAVEVPIEMLTRTGQREPADSPAATIGVWATTSRPRVTVRRFAGIKSETASQTTNKASGSRTLDATVDLTPFFRSKNFRQVQRMGNPLINELLIGIGSKDRFSMDAPHRDERFADFFLNPPIAKIVEALYGGALEVPPAPRLDLLPLVTYAAPIAAAGTPAGPIADLLRLNTGVPATPLNQASRLGLIAGDPAGFPNGRRLFDDVVDVVLRVGVGGVLIPEFNVFPNNRLGDGVNVNDTPYRTKFPFLGSSPDGRNRRHIDPGEPGGGPVQ